MKVSTSKGIGLFVLSLLFSLTGISLTSAQQGSGQEVPAQQAERKLEAALKLGAQATQVLQTQMQEIPTKRIPENLRQEAKCIAVFPQVIKAGYIVALEGGSGLVSCRDEESETWGAPAYFDIGAASIGLQAGVQTASVILLFTNDEGVQGLLQSKLSFGAGIGLAAGPVGGSANLSTLPAVVGYTRTKGLFAGIDLEGATLEAVTASNAQAYGEDASLEDILFQVQEIPDYLLNYHETLQQFTP